MAYNFFAPADWRALDDSDRDLGGSGPLPLQVPGATPSQLILALGKDGIAYLLDQAQLGGIGGATAKRRVSSGGIITAAAAYTTTRGTYVVFKGGGLDCPGGAAAGSLTAIRLGGTSPPTISVAWCAEQHGVGSPIVTTTDNPDHFYEAESHGVPLTLSGRTHGGQIRFPGGPPIIRHSRFCLDEGIFAFRSSLLVVSRGLGSVGLPWRWGADPEAILLEVVPRAQSSQSTRAGCHSRASGIIDLDNGGAPARGTDVARQLVEQHKVFAVFANLCVACELATYQYHASKACPTSSSGPTGRGRSHSSVRSPTAWRRCSTASVSSRMRIAP